MMIPRSFIFLAIVLASSIAQAQPGGGGFGGFRGRFLIDLQEVRTEIGVETQQAQLLDALQTDLMAQLRALLIQERERGPSLNTPEAQQERAEQTRDRILTFVRRGEELIDVILEPEQVTRLAQLRLQREGLRALDRAEVAERLQLTDEQQERLQELRQTDVSPSPDGFDLRRFQELREQQEEQFRQLLTEEQQAAWDTLRGKPFRFSISRRSGRGSRGRGQ